MSSLCEVGKFTVRSKCWKFVANVCKVKEPGLEMVKTRPLILGINQMQTLVYSPACSQISLSKGLKETDVDLIFGFSHHLTVARRIGECIVEAEPPEQRLRKDASVDGGQSVPTAGKEERPKGRAWEQDVSFCQMCKGFETQCQGRRPRTGRLGGISKYGLHRCGRVGGVWYELHGADGCGRHHLHLLIENLFLRPLLQNCREAFWPPIRGSQHAWIGVPKEAGLVGDWNVTIETMVSWKIFSRDDINHLSCSVINCEKETQVLSFTWDIPRMKPKCVE